MDPYEAAWAERDAKIQAAQDAAEQLRRRVVAANQELQEATERAFQAFRKSGAKPVPFQHEVYVRLLNDRRLVPAPGLGRAWPLLDVHGGGFVFLISDDGELLYSHGSFRAGPGYISYVHFSRPWKQMSWRKLPIDQDCFRLDEAESLKPFEISKTLEQSSYLGYASSEPQMAPTPAVVDLICSQGDGHAVGLELRGRIEPVDVLFARSVVQFGTRSFPK